MEFRRIFILCTYNCNLHCSYCYEHNKIARSLNVHRLQENLRKEFNLNFDGFILTFHGGEPFLSFNELKEICEWIWDEYPEKNIKCTVTTNGTILTDTIKNWLIVNRRRFHVGLSLDGYPETHNQQRGNSFDMIDINFFRQLHRPSAKMTVSPESVQKMFDNFLFVNGLGFDISITPALEIEWSHEALIEYGRQLKMLADHQLTHIDFPLLSIFHYQLDKFSDKHPTSRWNCGVGYYEVAYDIDGNQRLCHAFVSDFKTNSENNDGIVSLILNSSASVEMTECIDCPLFKACSPCVGLNFVNRNSISSIHQSFCSLTKIGMKITAYLYASALANGKKYIWLKDLDDIRIGMFCQGIKHVINV